MSNRTSADFRIILGTKFSQSDMRRPTGGRQIDSYFFVIAPEHPKECCVILIHSLGDTDQVPALTSDFISTPETAVLDCWNMPTTAQSAISTSLIGPGVSELDFAWDKNATFSTSFDSLVI